MSTSFNGKRIKVSPLFRLKS